MREFVSISFAQFSRAFWERVELEAHEYAEPVKTIGGEGQFSTNRKVAYLLFCLAHYYEPKTVCEIGTYRGRSTTALALGMASGQIWTCDKDVDWKFESPNEVRINRHYTTSTEMLKGIKEPIDLFFFDGRIQHDDVPQIKRLSHKHTVYVMDDFEGLEKGVHNALKLVDETKVLITGNERLAVVIPWHTVKLTHQ
jgi:Predicted O-methyltransferase